MAEEKKEEKPRTEVRTTWFTEMVQVPVTMSAIDRYEDSVKQNAPREVTQHLHDVKVWEETKSHALGLATTEAANKAIAAQNQSNNPK